MKRSISGFALLLTSISAIIGSGWLFGAFYTASIAGPAAILSWVIGGAILIFVAFVYAEICGMLPISGSSARIPQYTHGTVVSFLFSWMIWLSYLALMATEVQAVIQYASFYFPYLTKHSGGLTAQGYIIAGLLMFMVSFINTYSLRWLIRFNNLLAVLKLIIPIVIVTVILVLFFKPEHVLHPGNSAFMPTGWHGVLGAMATGGIVFAFNGFKQAAEMAGEAKNPSRSVPFAIIGSVCICLVLFLLIQLAFFSSLNVSNLIHGWGDIQLSNTNSPLASIVDQDNLQWLLPILYVGAIIAPLAAGLMYCSSASRSIYGMSKNGYLPALFQKLTPQGNPGTAILLNFMLGMLLFAPLPGWNKMVAFLTSLLAITYAIGPICMLALRQQAPDQKRPLKLPFGTVWATVAFYLCTLLAYWSGWDTLSKLSIALAIGILVLFLYHLFAKGKHKIHLNWQASIWMWPYFIGLSAISYIGNYGGGLGLFHSAVIMVLLAILCIVTAWLSVKFKLPAATTLAYIEELQLHQHDRSH
ncbi:MAG: APC family permease [Gammaproteobacteria bacterium]|nr:APC family permease [Gammaproteobacteria bacterium]